MDPTETEDTGLDIESTAGDIGRDLGFGEPESSPQENETDILSDLPPETGAPAAATSVREPPKSWAKEQHAVWAKMPPEAQDYYETREKQFHEGLEQYKGDAGLARQYRDAIAPYKAMIQAQGISETQAIQYLLHSQHVLTNGTPEERLAAYQKIGRDMGINLPAAGAPAEENIDPSILALRKDLDLLKTADAQRQRHANEQARAESAKQVDAFASDKANLYFDEVAPDMVPYINAGLSMPEAYEKAVWANPVTRAKELARLQTEADAKLKEKARAEGKAAKQATRTNIRGQESRQAPTEPKGTLDDTLRATLKQIKERAH